MDQKRGQKLGRGLQALIKPGSGEGGNEEEAAKEEHLQEDMEKDAEREQSKKTQVHRAWCVVFWVLVIICLVMLLVCVWHWFAPQDWRWLSDTEVKNLSGCLISAGGGAFGKSIVKYL